MRNPNKTRKPWLMIMASTLLMSCLLSCGAKEQPSSASSTPTSQSVIPSSSSGGSTVAPSSTSESQPVSTFTVTFNFNYSGSKPTQVKVEGGKAVAEPEDPTREGYSFTGWYTEKDCENLFDFATPITKNLVLFAGWEQANLTVTFNFNYVGAPATQNVTVAKGETVEKPTDPEREDYAFVAWCLDASGEQVYDFSSIVNESFTLYAKWSLSVATITFDLGYETTDSTFTVKTAVGKAMEAPESPTRTGYNFQGWFVSLSDSNPFDFSSVIENSFSLTAKWEIIVLTVTFNYNYGTVESTTVNVEYGKTVQEPENKRSGYLCVWQLSGAEFDFSTPITESIVLTASWQAESTDSFVYTYYYNYAGAPSDGVYLATNVKKNNRPSIPEKPTRGGYYFSGWYSDSACTTSFNFNGRASADQSIYAKWLSIYTLEAEYVNLDGKMGFGFSVNLTGTDMIYPDRGTHASNGYYVSGLYYENAEIEFDFNVDKAVADAVVIMRIQCEFDTKTFSPETYTVTVNGVALDYEAITIEGLEEDTRSDVRRPFIDVEFNDRASLKKGANVIKMITTNKIVHGNTRQADAPMIDCVYVCTDAGLTWSPRTDNLEGK